MLALFVKALLYEGIPEVCFVAMMIIRMVIMNYDDWWWVTGMMGLTLLKNYQRHNWPTCNNSYVVLNGFIIIWCKFREKIFSAQSFCDHFLVAWTSLDNWIRLGLGGVSEVGGVSELEKWVSALNFELKEPCAETIDLLFHPIFFLLAKIYFCYQTIDLLFLPIFFFLAKIYFWADTALTVFFILIPKVQLLELLWALGFGGLLFVCFESCASNTFSPQHWYLNNYTIGRHLVDNQELRETCTSRFM